jgi:hypothetical protein
MPSPSSTTGGLPPMPEPAQDPQQMQSSPTDIFMQMLTQRLGETPPPPMQMSHGQKMAAAGLLTMHPQLAQLVLAQAHSENNQAQAEYESRQRQIPALAGVIKPTMPRPAAPPGWKAVQDENGEWTWIQAPMSMPSGQPVTSPSSTVPSPGQLGGATDVTPANITKIPGQQTRSVKTGVKGRTPPLGYQLGYDEQGKAMWFPKPGAGPLKAIPALDPQGGQVRKSPPANLLGIQQQLDTVQTLVGEMRSNYQQGPTSGIKRGVGTAGANLFSRGVGAQLGLSGLASQLDQHAVIHERDREAAATALAFPLTGSRRSVEGARQSLLNIIPHYSDPPEVWQTFDRQMQQLVENARRMPWGENPDSAQDLYGQMLESVVGQPLIGGAGESPDQRKARIQAIIDRVKGGGQ